MTKQKLEGLGNPELKGLTNTELAALIVAAIQLLERRLSEGDTTVGAALGTALKRLGRPPRSG